MRDLRVLNFSAGQKIESDDVMKRIGELELRNSGTISKMALFDSGKALIVGTGLRVEPSSGMTVNVPSGSVFQRLINTGNVLPCQQITDQTVTIDAATGTPRTDIIEAQVYTAEDKTDTVQEATVLSSGGESQVTITNESVERDIRYYLRVQKSTGTTTPTGGTPGELTGTADLSGTVDLSTVYLINLRDGEDGDFQEIDCRGATPAATTRSEIITAINTAVGRTMATASGDYLKLTGESLGEASTFSLKPPNTDDDLDAINAIFGLSLGNYKLVYSGTNEWFKLAELDIGASTTTITSGLIRNINQKSTWTGESEHTLVETPVFELIDDIIDGTQQLSNTKLNEAVALTATSSELNSVVDGWIPLSGTFTYASATTMTTSIDLTGILEPGMKLKITQPTDGIKYFTIQSITSSLITVATATYDLDNEAITSPYYSHSYAPFGWPDPDGKQFGDMYDYGGTTPPHGSLVQDGSAISRTEYALLFAKIGTTWGVGDGSTTFNLPDGQGMFRRGAGTHGTLLMADGNYYAGPAVGSSELDQGFGHVHKPLVTNASADTSLVTADAIARADSAGENLGRAGAGAGERVWETGGPADDGTYGTPRSGDENRPVSIGVLPCIKAY